jgi:hypothetical protein
MRRTIRLSLVAVVSALVLAAAPPVRAQLIQGFSGGLNVAGPSLDVNESSLLNGQVAQSYRPGFNATVFVGRQMSRRLAVRLDLSISRVSQQQTRFVMADPVSGPCWGRCPVQSSGAPVGIADVTAKAVATLTSANRGGQLYLLAGVGPNYVYQNPDGPRAVRVGGSAGAGWLLPWGVGGQSRLFVEAQFRHLFDSPTELSWMVPVTLGIRF